MGAENHGMFEVHIDRWRAQVLDRGLAEQQVAALETELRGHIAALAGTGLDAEEAFLVALKRVAAGDEATRAFVATYAGVQWAGPTASHAGTPPFRPSTIDIWVMLACALGAALAVKVPTFFGIHLDGPGSEFYTRNVSLLVLPFLGMYLAWTRRLSARASAVLAAAFLAGAAIANLLPFTPGGATETLTAIHLLIVLWLVLGVAHAGGEWRSAERRMEYVRFTGEWLINYALIALGGGVLVALTVGVFEAINLDVSTFIGSWVLPCGAAGAVIVAGWLAGSRRNPIGGMAPVLARVFTPLFAVMLVTLLVGVISTRGVMDIEREVLIFFDLLLVIVLALLLYAISARDPEAGRGFFDWIQLMLVVCALAVDVFALVNIAGRLAEYGFSSNRTAALGLNLLLLVNLGWSAVLQMRFLRGRHDLGPVTAWQMRYLPLFALWAAVVAVAFPALFGFA